ncbi:hypothetical protein HY479_02695 [Candidatus Uhrbacteria bacterium]|nr:hypothetical protein [Candidatus Uhrbacteria bacterium]
MALPPSILVNIHAPRFDGLVREAATRLRLEAEQKVTKTADDRIEERRKLEMDERGTQARTGRSDTGTQAFGKDGVKNVDAASFVELLMKLGYVAVKAFYRRQPLRSRSSGAVVERGEGRFEFKYIVRVIFSREPKEIHLGPGFMDAYSGFLRGKTFQTCHVWNNDYSDTVNLAGGVDPNCGTVRHLVLDNRGAYSYTVENRGTKPRV